MRSFTRLLRKTSAATRMGIQGSEGDAMAVVALRGQVAPFDNVLAALGAPAPPRPAHPPTPPLSASPPNTRPSLPAFLSFAGEVAGNAPEVFARTTERLKRIPLLAGFLAASDRMHSLRTGIEDTCRSLLGLIARMQVIHARAKLSTVQEYLEVTDNLQVLLGMLMLSVVESLEMSCGQLRVRRRRVARAVRVFSRPAVS